MGARVHWIFALAALMGVACSSSMEVPNPNNLGYQYYPIEVGSYRIYDVVEVHFPFIGDSDTTRYQLKELIQGIYRQEREDTAYYLHRLTRRSAEVDWQLDSIWTVRKNPRSIVVVENNTPVIKLTFPVKVGASWDSNAMNAEESAVYAISKVGVVFEQNGLSFENTLQVVEENNMDTVINERYREAIYAENIGLVYKEARYIDYCATSVACLGEGIIVGGIKKIYTLREYGKE